MDIYNVSFLWNVQTHSDIGNTIFDDPDLVSAQ
jgi:hypothetical protein